MHCKLSTAQMYLYAARTNVLPRCSDMHLTCPCCKYASWAQVAFNPQVPHGCRCAHRCSCRCAPWLQLQMCPMVAFIPQVAFLPVANAPQKLHLLHIGCKCPTLQVANVPPNISYHIISYHIISYHIISYHIISYLSMVAHSTKLVYKGPCI